MDRKEQLATAGLKGVITKQTNTIMRLQGDKRHIILRLKKLRNSIDYLLQHPLSCDASYGGKKHQRDIPKNQKSKEIITEEFYKKAYDKEYRKLKLYIEFIETLESHTSDWDDLCDCGCEDGIHTKECQTSLIRLDVARLRI